MIATVVIQEHESGQKNVAFSTDPEVDPADLIVTSGGWERSSIKVSRVHIMGDSDVIQDLCSVELRSVENQRTIEVLEEAHDNPTSIS